MSINSHIDWDMFHAIQDLVDEGLLDVQSKGYGIAQQVIHQGYDSLSDNQKYTFNTQVAQRLGDRKEQLEIQRVIDSNPE